MRAVLVNKKLETLSKKDSISISRDQAHHLIKVIRLKENETVLALDGFGFSAICNISFIGKKDATLQIVSIDKQVKKNLFDLAVCKTKREAFEDVVKSSVEIGISTLIPTISKNSNRFDYNQNRLKKIIENAMVQSNSHFFLNIEKETTIKELSKTFKNYDYVFYFSPTCETTLKTNSVKRTHKKLIVIGPEGGLTEIEEELLKKSDNIVILNLPTNILRTKTAISVATGVVIGLTK